MDQQGEDGQHQAVSHVEDAHDLRFSQRDFTLLWSTNEKSHLRDDNPEDAEPPETHRSKECADNVTEGAGENVAQNILNGVTCSK